SIGLYVLYPDPIVAPNQKPTLGGIGNSGVGVLIQAPTNNTVGGTLAEARNTIAGNGLQGVGIDTGADGNLGIGNLISIAPGSSSIYFGGVGNGAEGVLVRSSSNAIGEAVSGAGNVISQNHGPGVHVTGVAATRNLIQGNDIGTDTGGTFVFGQGFPGNLGD